MMASEIAKALAVQPGGVTYGKKWRSAIATALKAQPGVTSEEQVAMAIEKALKAEPGVSAADIAKAVESAVASAVAQAFPT